MTIPEFDEDDLPTPSDFRKSESLVTSEVFLRLAAFNCSKRLQVELLLMFVKTIDSDLLRENLEAF